ncbi:hypothetical protein [Polynucleobacter necessarius]|uniref:hypothetical protein n=1 Tax=Polynucleobacter necessarius TaxID=576610 RepID=UPI0018D510C7|nr:hypothetical protein [Polynucleobacter necessarius]
MVIKTKITVEPNKRFLLLALLDLLVVGWLPASEVVLRGMENLIPKVELSKDLANEVGGIVILGGAIKGGEIAVDRGEISIHSSVKRVTKAFELIRKNPTLPYVFSGYSGRITTKGISARQTPSSN